MNEQRSVRITIRGRISPRLAEAFEGMALERSPRGAVLVGHLVDQSQLHGLLARIRDLGLELESVTTTEPGSRWARCSQGGPVAPSSAVRRDDHKGGFS